MRAPTSDPHTIKCMQVPLSLIHLSPFAEAASFDKKELCRSDTVTVFPTVQYLCDSVPNCSVSV